MSTYEYLIEKGKQEGLEKGLEKGHLEKEIQIVLNANAAKMPIALIANITNLSEERVLEIIKNHSK